MSTNLNTPTLDTRDTRPATNARKSTLPQAHPLPAYPVDRADAHAEKPQVSISKHTDAARLVFVDNLRWALTVLVILHHLAITYGAEGNWYYVERPIDLMTSMILTLFAGLNQGYFMGLFFLIAGYFVPQSLDRKGTRRFLHERYTRLGLPLLFYMIFIGPVLNAFVQLHAQDSSITWSALWNLTLTQWQEFDFSAGPLWFVETLLYFSVTYAFGRLALRLLGFGKGEHTSTKLTGLKLLALAIGIALASFATRLAFPIGVEWNNLQLAFFPQYIALFAAGILAYRNQWLPEIPKGIFRGWAAIALVAILALPAMMMLPGVQENFDSVMGGWHLYSFLFATWEAFYALGMSIALLGLFRLWFNQSNAFSRYFSTSAYAAYIIHAPIVVTLAYAFSGFAIHPMLKFGVLALPATGITFALAHILVKHVPGAKRVL